MGTYIVNRFHMTKARKALRTWHNERMVCSKAEVLSVVVRRKVLGHSKWARKADSLLLLTSLTREFNRLGRIRKDRFDFG